MQQIPAPQFSIAQVLAACAMTLLVAAAGSAPAAEEEISKVPAPRRESLELPGLTAGCHICEWRPKFNQMPASEECGGDESGAARVGLFECGFSQDCRRECHFVRCGTL